MEPPSGDVGRPGEHVAAVVVEVPERVRSGGGRGTRRLGPGPGQLEAHQGRDGGPRPLALLRADRPLKAGALPYGGGFVIIPPMQHDAVHTYHWMTNAQFLDAVPPEQARGVGPDHEPGAAWRPVSWGRLGG
jgi:hypothetical protein